MHFLKKISFLILLIFSNLKLLHAQQKFVEVTITDTVLAEANFFIYEIIGNSPYAGDESTNSDTTSTFTNATQYYDLKEKRNQKNKKYFDSLVLSLKKQKFVFLQHSINNNFTVSNDFDKIYYEQIVLNSYDSLLQLYEVIKNQKKINGIVLVSKAKNESDYENALYKKIIDEAYKKAKSIANYTKQKIIGILSVIQNNMSNNYTGGWTAYPPLSLLGDSEIPGWHTNIQSENQVSNTNINSTKLYSIKESLTIRFQAE